MSERRIIGPKIIMVGALIVSVVALPFSVKICHAAIIVLTFSWLLEGNWRTKFSIVNQSLLLQLIIALFFIQLVGLAFAENLEVGWFSLEKKIFFVLLPVVLATTSIKLEQKDLKRIIGSFVIACFVGTVICIVAIWQQTELVMAGEARIDPYLSGSSYFELHGMQSDKWLLFSYTSLANGIDIHPTYFSLFLVFSVIWLLIEYPQLTSRLQKVSVLFLLTYFLLFVVFLSSRIMILGLGAILFFVFVRSALKRQKASAFLAMGTVLFFSALLFLNPVTRYRSLQEINPSTFQISPGNDYTNAAQIRVSLWWLAFQSLENWDPVFGTGTGGAHDLIAATANKMHITNIINSYDPHNQFLYTLLANGVPGFILLILFLGFPVYFAWGQRDLLLLGLSFIVVLACMTESALELQKGIVFYAIFSGLLFFHRHSFQSISLNHKSLLRAGH